MIQKTIENGNLKINGLSFFEFSNRLRGFDVISKKTGRTIPRFILFWKGLYFEQIVVLYSLINKTR